MLHFSTSRTDTNKVALFVDVAMAFVPARHGAASRGFRLQNLRKLHVGGFMKAALANKSTCQRP